MLYNLEQIKRRCDVEIEKGRMFSVKTIFGERDIKYPRNTPTTYMRKWDFKDVPVKILNKYNLEPKEYYYCGSHQQRTQKTRDYLLYYDIAIRKANNKASQKLREFFVNYINYYVNEKNKDIIETVKFFFEVEKMIYSDDRNKMEKIERFENDKLLIRQFKGEPIVLLSDSPKDTTLMLDKEKNKLVERKGYEGEFKENINKTLSTLVVRGMKQPEQINNFLDYWFSDIEFKNSNWLSNTISKESEVSNE